VRVRRVVTHHDLTKFAPGDITQLNFLHGYGLSGCPVERAWAASRFQNGYGETWVFTRDLR
jgi:hypothetical protein